MRRGSIPLWRLVGGAFLHFGLVAFLILVPLTVLLFAPTQASAAQVSSLALRYSAFFLAALLSLGCVVTASVALAEQMIELWKGRSEAADALDAASQRDLAAAVEIARRALGYSLATQTEVLASEQWCHGDHRYQALSRDLNSVISSAAAAIGKAPIERRIGIMSDAATAVALIGQELSTLNSERGRVDEDRARAAALYAQSRYRPSNFSIPPD